MRQFVELPRGEMRCDDQKGAGVWTPSLVRPPRTPQASPFLCLFARAVPSPRLSFPPLHPPGSSLGFVSFRQSVRLGEQPQGERLTLGPGFPPCSVTTPGPSGSGFLFSRAWWIFSNSGSSACAHSCPHRPRTGWGRRPNLPGYGVPSKGQYGRSVCFRIQNTPNNTHLLTTSPA